MLRPGALAGLWALAFGVAHAGPEPLLMGAIQFQPCDLSLPESGWIGAQCARYSVAEDPDNPGGRRIELRLALIPAASKKPLPDPVLFLAGGPGQSAVAAWPSIRAALGPVARKRQILLVDQRGTGKSNPLTCAIPDWTDPAVFSMAAARTQARLCQARLADRADTRFYTTGNYVRDLESVRRALGVAQFNLIGGSYGTRVALEYLRRHAGAVRSVFIDSVVPPELALLQDHAVNLEQALRGIGERCSRDAACQKKFGDVHQDLHALARRLAAHPQQVVLPDPTSHQPLTVPFNEVALLWVARFFSYSPESASLLPLLLREAAQGRPQALLAQVVLLARKLPDQIAHGLELSVICAEDADRLKARPEAEDTLMGNEVIGLLKAQCAQWPHGRAPADFNQPVVSDKPVLLLSGEFDPVTPPRYAQQVARTLSRSRALIAKGQGHTPMAKGCMPRLLEKFFDTLDPVGLDASCLEVLGDTPFFLGTEGPSP